MGAVRDGDEVLVTDLGASIARLLPVRGEELEGAPGAIVAHWSTACTDRSVGYRLLDASMRPTDAKGRSLEILRDAASREEFDTPSQ